MTTKPTVDDLKKRIEDTKGNIAAVADMTWDESTLSRDTALASESALAKVWADDDDIDIPLTYAALVATVYRLQNEMHGLAAQVVELREKVQAWEGDS